MNPVRFPVRNENGLSGYWYLTRTEDGLYRVSIKIPGRSENFLSFTYASAEEIVQKFQSTYISYCRTDLNAVEKQLGHVPARETFRKGFRAGWRSKLIYGLEEKRKKLLLEVKGMWLQALQKLISAGWPIDNLCLSIRSSDSEHDTSSGCQRNSELLRLSRQIYYMDFRAFRVQLPECSKSVKDLQYMCPTFSAIRNLEESTASTVKTKPDTTRDTICGSTVNALACFSGPAIHCITDEDTSAGPTVWDLDWKALATPAFYRSAKAAGANTESCANMAASAEIPSYGAAISSMDARVDAGAASGASGLDSASFRVENLPLETPPACTFSASSHKEVENSA